MVSPLAVGWVYSEDEETKQPVHLMVSGKLQRDRECSFKGISASK